MIQPIHKIAVPIDFSPYSKAAVSYAAGLAKWSCAALALINVIDQRGLDDVLVGSCAEKLFRHSPVPVLSIPASFVSTYESKSGEDSAAIKKA